MGKAISSKIPREWPFHPILSKTVRSSQKRPLLGLRVNGNGQLLSVLQKLIDQRDSLSAELPYSPSQITGKERRPLSGSFKKWDGMARHFRKWDRSGMANHWLSPTLFRAHTENEDLFRQQTFFGVLNTDPGYSASTTRLFSHGDQIPSTSTSTPMVSELSSKHRISTQVRDCPGLSRTILDSL